MKEVIAQISKIDKMAFESEQLNKTYLNNEISKYEDKIKSYHDQKLKEANDNADIVYTQIIDIAKAQSAKKKIESAKEIEQLKLQFSKVEKDVIEEIFEELLMTSKRG